ncbi:Transcription regulator LuxR, C-terminal [uncultured Caudovirales phage]|uniref:Transcription regulator LuxR, C-terminal n=1 Tax=uncultured Caudovirales phage TaxID=2100421 RepID=A0A6J5LHE9_9CAUD|nr:Transcription regulator LuxR, C-terminal [uncultured Caudovirales phage]
MNERQKKILEFCANGKKSYEIANQLGLCKTSVYNDLRTLQQIGLLAKTNDHRRRGMAATFTTVGYEPQLDKLYEREYNPELVNIEFIKHSHNIWGTAT